MTRNCQMYKDVMFYLERHNQINPMIIIWKFKVTSVEAKLIIESMLELNKNLVRHPDQKNFEDAIYILGRKPISVIKK